MLEYLPISGLLQIALFIIVVTLCVKPLGTYMAQVLSGHRNILSVFIRPIEKLAYKFLSINEKDEMTWKHYLFSVLVFTGLNIFILFLILIFQGYLPFNTENEPGLSWHLALNAAVSFVTNTDWQSYSPESIISNVTQSVALTVQNFISASIGISVLAALIRGFNRKNARTIGNFWVDMIRTNLYILLPLSLIFAFFLSSQGVLQSFNTSINVSNLENGEVEDIPSGPIASQIAIKQIGSNGGGFLNANAAHPLENPNALTNFFQLIAILLIPASLTYTYGRMVKDTRQGWALYAAMMVIFIPFIIMSHFHEQRGNIMFDGLGLNQAATLEQPGGNMEGKEARFGITNSSIWSIATAASNGSVNSMHDSYTPLGGLAPMIVMLLGEVVFGGTGSGMYGMLIFVLISVFLAGLMVGRTPEYLGKKIQAFDIKMASIALLSPLFIITIGSAITCMTEVGRQAVSNAGPHGFSQILYAFTSVANNNGSAFAGLAANSPYFNTILAVMMLIGRYTVITVVLAIAGSLAQKSITPSTAGTLPTHTPLFICIIILVLIIGVLSFLPALAMGPIAEHLILGSK